MTTTADSPRAGPAWHFWLVAVIAVLWNGYGGYDYTMSHLQGEVFYRQMGMTDAQIAYLNAMPAWMHGVWALGVWGSVAGSILLILRMRWAVHAFALSLLGVIGNVLYTFVLTNGAEVNGPAAVGMTAVIAAGCVFFLWYSWLMAKRGVLR
ncbi:MAG: hypothetical protein ACOY5Y_08145 [Pseudomonadota bacterium]